MSAFTSGRGDQPGDLFASPPDDHFITVLHLIQKGAELRPGFLHADLHFSPHFSTFFWSVHFLQRNVHLILFKKAMGGLATALSFHSCLSKVNMSP
jgi:hypothetical protein